MSVFLLGVLSGLILAVGVWSVVGPYLRDRKRAEGVDRATAVSHRKGRRRDCRGAPSAGRRPVSPPG